MQCVAVCCSVLQCVAVCCSVLVIIHNHMTHTRANNLYSRCIMHFAFCVSQCVAVWCSVVQRAAVCCSVLQCVAVCEERLDPYARTALAPFKIIVSELIRHFATLCTTLQHTATLCNTLQHTAAHCNTLRHTATHCNGMRHTTTRCNTLQHTATHCNTLQHTATHCNTPDKTCAHASRMPKCPVLVVCQSAVGTCRIEWALWHTTRSPEEEKQQHIATHCHTLQHL